jgi:hypothetical protein
VGAHPRAANGDLPAPRTTSLGTVPARVAVRSG